LKITFYNTTHHLESLIDGNSKNGCNNSNNSKSECPATFLKVLGEPLILRNIKVAGRKLILDKVLIPNGLRNTLRIVQEAFPNIDVEEFSDDGIDERYYGNHNDIEGRITATSLSSQHVYSKVIIGGIYESLEIPLNACLHYSENKEKSIHGVHNVSLGLSKPGAKSITRRGNTRNNFSKRLCSKIERNRRTLYD